MSSAVFICGVVALAQLFVLSTQANRGARTATSAAVLAQQKMEQMRSLSWGFDILGLPLTDTTSDISKVPTGNGGNGLSPSPAGTLQQNITGYVDYLDQFGNWVGNAGGSPPPGAVFIRRWSVEPLPTNPNNTLILQVLVTRVRNRGIANNATDAGRLPDEARLVSVKTRKTI